MDIEIPANSCYVLASYLTELARMAPEDQEAGISDRVAPLGGTLDDYAHESRRAFFLLNRIMRSDLPDALDVLGLTYEATCLRNLVTISDHTTATAAADQAQFCKRVLLDGDERVGATLLLAAAAAAAAADRVMLATLTAGIIIESTSAMWTAGLIALDDAVLLA